MFGLQQQLSYCTAQPGWWSFAQQTSGPALLWIPSKGVGWSPTVLGDITPKLEMALVRAQCWVWVHLSLWEYPCSPYSDMLQRQGKRDSKHALFSSDVCPVENAQLSATPQISSHTQLPINQVVLQFLTQSQPLVQRANSRSRTGLWVTISAPFPGVHHCHRNRIGFPPALLITQANSAWTAALPLGSQGKESLYPSALQLAAWAWVSAFSSHRTPFPPILPFVNDIFFTTKCGRSASALPVLLLWFFLLPTRSMHHLPSLMQAPMEPSPSWPTDCFQTAT